MDSTLPLVSLICTADASAAIIQRFHGELFRVLRPLETSHRFEIVYVGTRQSAGALACIESLAQLDPRIRILPPDTTSTDAQPQFADAAAAMVVLMEASAHSPALLPELLKLASGPAEWIEGVPATAAPRGWKRLMTTAAPAPSTLLLAKRSVLDRVPFAASLESWSQAMKTANVIHVELPYQPVDQRAIDVKSPVATGYHAPTVVTQATTILRRWVVDVYAIWCKAPLEFISYFGATIFIVGVFLALWFTVQGLIARGSIWFSWCYLIVLLHILGGSILFALGKVGTLATRISEKIEARSVGDQPTSAPTSALRDAA